MTTYPAPHTCATEGCRNPALANNKRCPKCLNELQRTGWQEPTYAPLALYARAPQPNRKNSSKANRT